MDSIWTIGLGFVLCNIVLVIVLNILSDYIYDRVSIKAVVSVSIAVTGTIGIIWGLWNDKIPMLLGLYGIKLIVAMMLWILLTSSKKKVQMSSISIISVIIAVTNTISIVWGLGIGKIPVLSGVTLILLMVIWIIVTILIDVVSSIVRAIGNIISLQKDIISLQRDDLVSRGKIIEVFGEAIQLLQKTQVENVSLFKEALTELQQELDDNEETLRKNTEELRKFERELSNTVKIPKLFRK